MNWYKIANNKIFIGNCISGLDDPYFQNTLGIYDATELAQLVENGIKISYEQFLNYANLHPETIKKIQQNPENYEFYYNRERNIVWIYNINEDVEYFYK